ncbi:MAG TPA: toll/interleukin-1 receptor domain-containing protein [Xanthobacteraceae bacterium]|nr:toll/interleukin-1 receptor domain-containing protein [Xanthobacteraceae bacterium]
MPEPARDKPNVFICYAKEDHAFAREIFAALRENGLAAWMDRPPEAYALEGLLPGQDCALQIEQKLSEADSLVVLLSPASIAQQSYVQPEFRLALHAAARRKLPIVPLLQSACEAPAFSAGGAALNGLAWIEHATGGTGALIAAIKRNAAPPKAPLRPAGAKTSAAITRPTIRWRAFLGRVHWRNTIEVEDSRLYLTSCGARWNQDDRGDGVYCLDAQSGALHWAFNSAGDANEALIHGDCIVVGSDAGQLALLDKSTGVLKQECRVWHPIFARPFALGAGSDARIFAVSHNGIVLMADTGAGKITEVATLPFLLRANPAVSADGRLAVLFGERGEIARAWCEDGGFKWEQLATKTYLPPGAPARRNAGLVAAPVFDGESVIGGATRDSYYSAPALFRYDVAQRKFLWGEREQEPRDKDNPFGNLRSRPLVMGDEVIFAPAYAAALYAADKDTGEIRWKIQVGKELQQQWSSPVQVDERRVLLARADGILYQIDVAARKIEWALSLLVTPSEVQAANRAGKFGPGPSEAAHNGITATPAWHDGRIFLGTTEGQLFCIEQGS